VAYYLYFDGADDRVLITGDITAGQLEIDVDLDGIADGTNYFLGFGKSTGRGEVGIQFDVSGGQVTLHSIKADVTVVSFPSTVNVSGRTVFLLKVDDSGGDSVALDVDGVQVLPPSSVNDSRIFALSLFEDRNYPLSLYRFRHLSVDGSTVINDWDPSASHGTGSTLPDIVGTRDVTLVNFPTDDSQWVFYSAGGATIPTLSLASATSITANSIVPNVTFTF